MVAEMRLCDDVEVKVELRFFAPLALLALLPDFASAGNQVVSLIPLTCSETVPVIEDEASPPPISFTLPKYTLTENEREIVSLQAKVTGVEDQYGVEHLHLSVSISYVNSLLDNGNVRDWLSENAPGHYANLQELTATAGPRAR